MRLQQRFPETARSQGAGSSPGITGEDGTGMCRGSCKNPLMRQGQKGLPGRGIQKVFPAPLSSPLLPRSRSEQELCRALQAAFHPLWFLSSSGLQSSQHQPCRDSPRWKCSNQNSPSGGRRGHPGQAWQFQHLYSHQNHPVDTPACASAKEKGAQDPCSRAQLP